MNKVNVDSNKVFQDEELLLEINLNNVEIELENTKVLVVNPKADDITFIIKGNVEIVFINFNNDLKQCMSFKLVNNDSILKVGEIVFTNKSTSFKKINLVKHQSKDSISNYSFIGFAKDDSKLSSKIVSIVNKGIVGTKVKQKITCFTDGNAKVSADPILEIDEFDSEAYHGNSIGKLNESEITSLMSKGFSRNESIKIIKKGKINKVLSLVSKELILMAKNILEENNEW